MIENKTISVTTHCKKISNREQPAYCLSYCPKQLSRSSVKVVSALLLDDALKPATPLTNGTINLGQFA